uniref:Transmembrane protein n=1 Tax=Myoviridae sp. ctK5o5 TaxID=2827674 RepID=A0A8S5TD17_9CAUD|nr:MAG TPA: hypothetical protein [Myoviridae sp. ctK5o5]
MNNYACINIVKIYWVKYFVINFCVSRCIFIQKNRIKIQCKVLIFKRLQKLVYNINQQC